MKRIVKWIAIAAGVLLVIAGIGGFFLIRNMQSMMGGEVELSYTHEQHEQENEGSIVYMTAEITPEALMEIYTALGTGLEGNQTAVKLSTGEPPASNYLDPNLIKELVQSVNGTIVECNTAYGGSRSETAMHYQVAEDHGFTEIADVVIMDEDGSSTIPVEGGTHLKENYVGAHFPEYDGFLVLSHFKGHAMAGFGGAIKNISIGIGSAEGKCLIHTAGSSHDSPWGGEQNAFLESMAEAGKSVVDALDGNILFINVMNHLSIDCDCDGNPAEPDIPTGGATCRSRCIHFWRNMISQEKPLFRSVLMEEADSPGQKVRLPACSRGRM